MGRAAPQRPPEDIESPAILAVGEKRALELGMGRAGDTDAATTPSRAGDVAVVIVNWNGRRHLEHCLPALEAQELVPREIVVVDNASADDSLAWLRRQWPKVRVLALGANVGFAAANNRGIAATDAPWIALLNNDTVPGHRWLASLLAAGTSGEDVGSVASRMVFLDRPEIINSAGIAVDVAGIAWDRLGGAPAMVGEDACEVFGASAGAGLFRRAALLDAGQNVDGGRREVFDEQYFMYLEDVDLAWRLQLRGWRSLYAPQATVGHCGSATAGEGSPFKNYLLARNKVWTVLKDYPLAPLLAYSPLVVAYDVASAPYRLLLQGQTAALRGRAAALRQICPMLRKRRAIQARRRVPWSTLRARMSGPASPWTVLRRYRHLQGRAAMAKGSR